MRHIAIVPARKGSKSVPNKNVKPLGGTSLVHRAINVAAESKIFEKIILTTDIETLQKEFKDNQFIQVRKRHPELCTDSATMVPVILDALEEIKLSEDLWIWLLQPSSPFRSASDIFNILRLIESKRASSVISVENQSAHHPARYYTISSHGYLSPILGNHAQFENRQHLNPVYHRNGCFYVTRARDFKAKQTFYIPPCLPYIMNDVQSINIDSRLDWEKAEAAIRKRWIR